MNLLFDEVDVLETTGDPSTVDVHGISYDSRTVVDGDLFCCIPGFRSDGHDHADEAVANGAVGLLCERRFVELPSTRVVQAVVAPGTARAAMARAAAAFYGFPSRHLLMAGVTGTNGKTTVAHLLGAVLRHVGHPTTVLGTLQGARTTPEAPVLQRALAEARDAPRPKGAGQPAVAMEVSSHALVQARVDAVHFDVAVFTNLSHEHLDYHETMEAYFEAKASLFTPERAVRGVVNAEDRWGRRLLAEARIPLVAVRRDQASAIELSPGRSTFTWRAQRVSVAMTGAFNVENALLAAEAAVALGVEPAAVAAGLADAPPVPGRFEAVAVAGPAGPPFSVFVDYAHTPAGLETVLAEARALVGPTGRLIVVFGCGGERDREKRPMMGAAATAGADLTVVTSDNPRGEDPRAIIDEVVAGASPSAVTGGTVVVEPDRRDAIAAAVAAAGRGDVVVVAGKGHETTQEVGGSFLAFEDRAVVTDVLSARWSGTTHGNPPRPEGT